MKMLEPIRILDMSRRHSQATRSALPRPDMSRPFVHENFTQLYHTPFYSVLNREQRLRYNQLYGMRTNEQFQTFEDGFTRHVVGRLLGHPIVNGQPALRSCITEMLHEESRHHDRFRQFNFAAAPKLYNNRVHYFAQLRPAERTALRVAGMIPIFNLFLLWLIVVLEEQSIQFAQSMLRTPVTESLGPLDPTFLRVHQEHMRDELRHVHIDAHLITLLIGYHGALLRKINSVLFVSLLREILTPRRSGLNVIRQLVSEFPALRSHEKHMIGAVRKLRSDTGVTTILQDGANMPVTDMLIREFPDFAYAQQL